jgi:hypothetical protein
MQNPIRSDDKSKNINGSKKSDNKSLGEPYGIGHLVNLIRKQWSFIL